MKSRHQDAASSKSAPRALVWLIVLSSVAGPARPVVTTLCASGEQIAALELSVGPYHFSTSAFRCRPSDRSSSSY